MSSHTLRVIATCTKCGATIWDIPGIPALDRWPIETHAPSTVFCRVEEHNTGHLDPVWHPNYNFHLEWIVEDG